MEFDSFEIWLNWILIRPEFGTIGIGFNWISIQLEFGTIKTWFVKNLHKLKFISFEN